MKFFQKFNLKFKKNVFFLISGLIIFGFLFFPFPGRAGVLDPLLNVFFALPTLLIGAFLALAVLLSGAFAWLAGALLDWVTSPNFISFSYTNPAHNTIIANGLSTTQSLVNMFLVVVLIYTAISIALRLGGETQAKKLLVRLIFIALIVNFAPVICGLIVDASNILMNYFLVGIKEGVSGILSQAVEFGKTLISSLLKITGSFADKVGLLTQGAIQIILNLAIMLAFFLFAGIFLFRYFAIWILVVLAPLAFVAWILPATKKIWNMWWSNFLQWSIIGITMSFFLYLGMSTFGALRGALMNKITSPGIDPTTIGLFDSILPFLAVIIFLFLGFMMGLATSAMGASQAIALTKKFGKGAGKFAGKAGGALARTRLGAKGKEWMEKQATAKFMPQKLAEMKGLKGVAARALATPVTGTFWAVRRGIGEAGLRWTESERKDLRSAEKDYEDTTPERKMAAIRDLRLSPIRRMAALRQAIEEGQIKDLRKLRLTKDEIVKIGKESIKTHPEEFKKIRDAFPHLADEIGKGFSVKIREAAGLTFEDTAEATKYGNSIAAKLIAQVKTADIPKMDIQGVFKLEKDDDIRVAIETAMHQYWTGEKVGTATRNFDRIFMEPFHEEAEKRGIEWYRENNPRLATYLESSAAQGLGLRLDPKKKVSGYKPSSFPPSEKPSEEPSPLPPEEEKKPPRGRGGVGIPE